MEQQFNIAPEGSLKTYAQKVKYVRQRIADNKARSLSAKTLKQANSVNEVTTEQPTPVEDKKNVDTDPIINVMEHFLMYMKGKRQRQVQIVERQRRQRQRTRGRWRKWGKGEQR